MARRLLTSSGSSGGGGSAVSGDSLVVSMTPVSEVTQSTSPGYSYEYYHVMPGAADSIRHVQGWGLSRFWRYNGANQTGQKMQSVTINKSTGALSLGGETNVWSNGSGAALSTTFCTYDPYTGCFVCGGHNAWPGQSSHTFGHSKGSIDADGVLQSGSGSYTNKDHGYNGLFFSDYNANGYFLTAGYDAGSSSRSHWRGWQGTRNGNPSNTFDQVTSNFTSTANGQQIYGQWDYTPSGNDKVSGVGLALTGSSYGRGQYAANGNYTTWNGTSAIGVNTQSWSPHFRYSDGTLVNPRPTNYNLIWSDYSSASNNTPSGTEGYQSDPRLHKTAYHHQHIGLGSDHWLSFSMIQDDVGGMKGRPILWKINSNYDPATVKIFDQTTVDPAGFKAGGHFQTNATWHCVWENATDTYPKWLVSFLWGNDVWNVRSYEIAADFSTLIS